MPTKIKVNMKRTLRRLYIKEGRSAREVADKLRVSTNCVYQTLRRFHIPVRKPGTYDRRTPKKPTKSEIRWVRVRRNRAHLFTIFSRRGA